MRLNKEDWWVIYRALELARNSDVGSFYREETMEKVMDNLSSEPQKKGEK